MIFYDKLVDDTLDNLLLLKKNNFKEFFYTYKSLPFAIYKEIERLSVSKSSLHKERCVKAKEVSDAFHKSIK